MSSNNTHKLPSCISTSHVLKLLRHTQEAATHYPVSNGTGLSSWLHYEVKDVEILPTTVQALWGPLLRAGTQEGAFRNTSAICNATYEGLWVLTRL